MKLVIQRVKDACVMAEGEETGRIGPGFLVLVGIMEGDTEDLCGSGGGAYGEPSPLSDEYALLLH